MADLSIKDSKRRVARVLTTIGIVLCVFHFYAMWVLAATFAAGLVWWASILVLLGPFAALLSLFVCLWRPRQLIAAALNAILLVIYIGLWAPIIPRLSFRAGG